MINLQGHPPLIFEQAVKDAEGNLLQAIEAYRRLLLADNPGLITSVEAEVLVLLAQVRNRIEA